MFDSPILKFVTPGDLDARKARAAELEAKLKQWENSCLTVVENSERVRTQRQLKQQRDTLGAKIDLHALLRCKRRDRSPLWALVNPRYPISNKNGRISLSSSYDTVRYYVEEPRRFGFSRSQTFTVGPRASESLDVWRRWTARPQGGFPCLPSRVRQILALPQVRRANALGVLYQPETWDIELERPDPDPALLMQAHRGGPWTCLAVWGHDGPAIEEFIV